MNVLSGQRHVARAVSVLMLSLATLVGLALMNAGPAYALKPITVSPDQDRVEITSLGEFYDSRGDSLQLEMAAASDAVSGRMTVRAVTPGTNPNWVAFALQNGSDKPIERWLTAERYTMFGSGAIWPDLDARRIEAVTPSLGFVPERIKNDRADIFRITLEPGQTITYVAELSSERFARVYLWKPLDYEVKVRDRQLFNGVLLGLIGLLAIFLTAIFAANHKVIFPAAALVAWCVLAHLTVDFGFFHKLFQLRPEDYAIYRASTEAAMAASLLVFLHVFLQLGQSPSIIRMLLGLWIAGQLALVAVGVIDPRLASTFARLSFFAIGGFGALATGLLAFNGRDRALALVPTWLMYLVWVLAAGVVVTGRLSTEIAPPSLVAGLVLIVVLIGFTVTQFAFQSIEPTYGTALPAEQQLSALAVDGAGAAVFQWQTKRNEVKVSPLVEGRLGLQAGELSTKLPDFLKHVHEADRERLRMVMASVQDRLGSNLSAQFRLRHADSSMHWFDLQAANVATAAQRDGRFVGLLRDVTDTHRVQDRLVQDAVQCTLTGLPNRALFVDRLTMLMARARADDRVKPAILLIDLDRFKDANASFGLPVGDGLLLTIARRLQRQISGRDSLARVGGDQFAVLMEEDKDPANLAREAERIRRAVRAPIRIGGKDIVITASLGLAIYDRQDGTPDLLMDAEIAALRAKRAGTDRIELFQPDMRADKDDTETAVAALARALERGQVQVYYQPVIYLPTEELAGFKATARFTHPSLGTVDPLLLPLGVDDGALKARTLSFVLAKAAQDGVRWQKELPRDGRALFVSVNVPNADLLSLTLLRDLRQVLDQRALPLGTLKLEVSERAVMQNPERSGEILEQLKSCGADLVLDGFGAGFSSLAYLQKFAFDTFKIDGTLVQAAAGGEGAGAALVRSMVALSLELNRQVAADGVEEPADAAFLRGIGCAFAQGFYYGDPMPDKDVLQLLKLVRKAERKLEPSGLFRLAMKRPKPMLTRAAPGTENSSTELAVASQVAQSSEQLQPVEASVQKKDGRKKAIRRRPTSGAGSRTDASASAFVPVSAEMAALPQPTYASYEEAHQHQHGHATMAPAMAVGEGFAPNPLANLQAGLDELNGRYQGPQTYQAEPQPYGLSIGAQDLSQSAQHLNELAAALSSGRREIDPSQAMVELAAAMSAGSTGAGRTSPAPRVEQRTRVRTSRPPDLSKLPAGLAASLARLGASDRPSTNGANPAPLRRPVRTPQ